MTSRPLSVGRFFTSRSRLRSNVRAVASSRSTSSRVTSLMEMKCRFGGGAGGRRSSRMTRMSAIVSLLRYGYEQDLVDLVHFDELHLDALRTRGRKVLADVVGPNRKLPVAAIDEDGELDPVRAAVVEQGFDRRANRSAGVEDVVDEDDGLAFEREVERSRTHDRLRVPRGAAAADLNVVAIERDVDRTEGRRGSRPLFDEPAKSLCEGHAARLDSDQRDTREVRVS